MAHPLDGSRARVERAGDHLAALDALLERFAKDGGFRLDSEEDPESGELLVKVYSNRQPPVPPPPLASVLVGEALANLRSSLDYVVWQLAQAPSRSNQFPLCDNRDWFESKRATYLAAVPPPMCDKIERFQPYPNSGNGLLGILATLNNADKHRLLLTAATGFSGLKTRFRVSGLDSINVKGRDWVPFEDGVVVFRISGEQHPGMKPQVDLEVPHGVLFRDPDSGVGVTIADLRRIRLSVSNVVESFAADV
jgi:hypothetical protein